MYFTYSLSCSGEHVVSYGAIVQVKRSDTWRSILTRGNVVFISVKMPSQFLLPGACTGPYST
jgi:hypothetical protein